MAVPRLLNVFAGAGGLALGFEQAGFAIAGAIEPDPVHGATFQRNFPATAVACGPVSQPTLETLAGPPSYDVVAGSLPSSAFSVGGRRDPQDDRRELLDRFVDIVLTIRPLAYVLEAVPGILGSTNFSALVGSLARLNRSGYATPQIWNLDAASFGVPQTRSRVWVVGTLDGVVPPTTPPPTVIPVHRRPAGLPVLPRDGLPVGPTVWDAIGDLPDPTEYFELRVSDRMRKPRDLPEPSAWVTCLTSDESGGFEARRTVDEDLVTASQATGHTMNSVWRFTQTPQGSVEPVSRYYRLHAQGLSRTLRAGSGRDRGSFTGPRPLHPIQPRVVTVREAARLHGFPDWFGFNATKWHGFYQVGSSAPPPVARAVAAELVTTFGVHPKRTKAPLAPDESLLFLNLAAAARRMGATILPEPRRSIGNRPRPRRIAEDAPQLRLPVDDHFTRDDSRPG